MELLIQSYLIQFLTEIIIIGSKKVEKDFRYGSMGVKYGDTNHLFSFFFFYIEVWINQYLLPASLGLLRPLLSFLSWKGINRLVDL